MSEEDIGERRSEEDIGEHLQTSAEESRQRLVLNDPGRPAYHVLAAVVGVLFAVFGLAALVVAGDVPFAGRVGHGLVGLVVNRSTGILWVGLGLLTVLGAVGRGNMGAYLLTGSAALIVLVGLIFLSVYRTDANVVAYSVVDICVTWVAGMVVLWCGMHTFVLDEDSRLRGRRSVASTPGEGRPLR
jgi:hypothetical protein